MKKIQFYKLNRFKRLQDFIHSQEFMKELRSNMPCSEENHLKFKAQAREFLRTNGFNVDDDFEWVVWDNKERLLDVSVEVGIMELVQAKRPLMNYTGYSDRWASVEVDDQFAGTWQWGGGPYYDWCDDNCTDAYNIVKYDRNKIWARFRSDKDAMLFKLKWS